MKNTRNVLYSLMLMLAGVVNFAVQAQQKNGAQDIITKEVFTLQAPKGIVRTIRQDRNGNIWITSWEGVFKYNDGLSDGQGESFTNVTSKVSSARFFSVLEDRKGNFWFASIGSGVYYYDGKSFQNFTTKDGLASDRVTNIHEDKTGTIWFGTENGASRYSGKSLPTGQAGFRNLKMSEVPTITATDSVYTGAVHTQTDSVHVSVYQNPLPKDHWMHNDVNAIIEDKTGKFWFGTRGYAAVYDGKTFTTITNKDGKPFTNVRSIIKDKKGNIWLGGYDGLWRYDGSTFTNFTKQFVGYIYEDKKGNIWTSSESANAPGWVLSRYDGKTLSNKKPAVTEITNKPMIFGILEDDKGNIWFGALDGVYRYDARQPDGQGKTITGFKSAVGQK
jgi:ligand-binding sensor domain-containing protein